MSDTDQMTDSEQLRELRGAFSGVPLPDPPPLDLITARGDAYGRRRRRRYGLVVVSLAGAAAVTALWSGQTDGRTIPAARPGPDTIRTSAYTLVSNADGTATLTINPVELFDPAALQGDLEKHGIPAKVTVGSICVSEPEPAGFAQVYSYDPGPPGGEAVITIDPAAVPAGTELSFGVVSIPSGPGAAEISLIAKDSYTCTSSLPTDSPDERSHQRAAWLYRIPDGSATSAG